MWKIGQDESRALRYPLKAAEGYTPVHLYNTPRTAIDHGLKDVLFSYQA